MTCPFSLAPQIHPKYVFNSDDGDGGSAAHPRYDVAVIHLAERLPEYSGRAHAVCLPRGEEEEMELTDLEAELTGWSSNLSEDECGYAWFDREERRWYHTPPKVVREGEEEVHRPLLW